MTPATHAAPLPSSARSATQSSLCAGPSHRQIHSRTPSGLYRSTTTSRPLADAGGATPAVPATTTSPSGATCTLTAAAPPPALGFQVRTQSLVPSALYLTSASTLDSSVARVMPAQ